MASMKIAGGIKGRILGAGRRASRLTRRILSWLLLGAVYFLVFFPARLVISLAQADLLRTRRIRGAVTYWRKAGVNRSRGGYGNWYS